MLTRSKIYIRKQPDKDSKLIIILCEGEKTEIKYFNYFNGIASQIRIEIIPHGGFNSPKGLYDIACSCLLKSEKNLFPKYNLTKDDEVWFVIDTDDWKDQINELRKSCIKHSWNIAQSNLCFEVWLYYHFNDEKPSIEGSENPLSWKQYLNSQITGGFDPRKHPIFIEKAINNSKNNFTTSAIGHPEIGSTEVHLLAAKILPIIKFQLDLIKSQQNI